MKEKITIKWWVNTDHINKEILTENILNEIKENVKPFIRLGIENQRENGMIETSISIKRKDGFTETNMIFGAYKIKYN